ncbi:18S rRNA (guanine-N(7))-methyltransferase bud23 [Dictyocoela muelleri]|nr:18S rRNA (guanine-N(7))-methyltransferase bud23 [Dictyocoela muelleri]
MSLPEHIMPPEIFFTKDYNKKSTFKTQSKIMDRCLELLDKDGMILDIGCGSGILSGDKWFGIDICRDLLNLSERPLALINGDIGNGLPFKPGTFDGIVSVSCIQWLMHSFKKEHDPMLRIDIFFKSLYYVLKREGKAVLQFYPQKSEMDIFIKSARKAGFVGGVIIDNEGTRRVKYYLVLECYDKMKYKKNKLKATLKMKLKKNEKRRKKECDKKPFPNN